MAVTKERFAQGMTFQQYLDQMGTNKDKFVEFLNEIQIKPEDKAALGKLGKKLKLMVITEDWCGDALYNVPVVAKMVEGNPDIEMRVFLRDKNPDLIDQYLNQGMFKSIPVFAFFDENMKEVARLIERPQAHTDEIEKKMLEARRALRAERYKDWRQGVVNEVKSLLKA
jgi:thioredoxin family protein